MNKNKRTYKEIIAEKQEEKEKLEKDIAKLKKQESSKKKNKQSWKGELGDNSFGDGGERINTIFLGDDNLPHNYIKGKLEKATEEYRAKNCSDPQDFFSKDKEKFINIGLEIMSGDIISIICEKMIIGDCV